MNKWLGFVLAFLIILTYIAVEVDEMNRNKNPDAYDTCGYLGEAVYIKNTGSIINFPGLLISGQYKQANQHPLYMLLLSLFASQDLSFYINSKIITVLIGFILLILFYLTGKELYGTLIAAIAATGLILNYIFIEWTNIISCESLFMLFSLLTFYFTAKGFKDHNKFWLAGGIMAGFAFLTKGTGLFLLPGFALAGIFVYRFNILRNKYFYAFFILFLAIVSPLLIRNITVYHNPIFNMNYYIVKYGYYRVDETMYQVFNPHQGAGLWRFDESDYIESNGTTTRDAFKVPSDYKNGILTESNLFMESIDLKLERNFLQHWLRYSVSIVLILLFLIGVKREKSSGVKVYVLSTMITFIIGLSLVRPIPRYLLPVFPIFWIYCAFGLVTSIETIDRKKFLQNIALMKLLPYALILFLIVNLLYTTIKADLSNPLNSASDKLSREELVNWLNSNLDSDEKYLLGPGVNWQINQGTSIFPPLAKLHDFKSLTSFAERQQIHYLIIDEQYVLSEQRKPDYKVNMNQYFNYNFTTGLIQNKPLQNWTLVYKSSLKPCDFLIYKLSHENQKTKWSSNHVISFR